MLLCGALRTLVCAMRVCCQKPKNNGLKVFLRKLSFYNKVLFKKPCSLWRLNRIKPREFLEEYRRLVTQGGVYFLVGPVPKRTCAQQHSQQRAASKPASHQSSRASSKLAASRASSKLVAPTTGLRNLCGGGYNGRLARRCAPAAAEPATPAEPTTQRTNT